jgi:mono/diheme cytochrome c family protein
MTSIKSAIFAAVAAAALAACQGSPSSSQAQAASKNPNDPAETIFTQRCATCHGADGKGNGPGSAALDPKPRNFQDQAWQSSITDEQIEMAIRGGGPAVGKSINMPPNPDLAGKPEVVAALRVKIRAFGGK